MLMLRSITKRVANRQIVFLVAIFAAVSLGGQWAVAQGDRAPLAQPNDLRSQDALRAAEGYLTLMDRGQHDIAYDNFVSPLVKSGLPKQDFVSRNSAAASAWDIVNGRTAFGNPEGHLNRRLDEYFAIDRASQEFLSLLNASPTNLQPNLRSISSTDSLIAVKFKSIYSNGVAGQEIFMHMESSGAWKVIGDWRYPASN